MKLLTSLTICPELTGYPYGSVVLGFLSAFQPTEIRLSEYHLPLNGIKPGRITILLKDGYVYWIWYECELSVDFPFEESQQKIKEWKRSMTQPIFPPPPFASLFI